MLIKDDSEFNKEFPEKYNWSLADSLKLSELAERVAYTIIKDLQTKNRLFVPGLRVTLVYISEICSVYSKEE